MNLKNLSRRAFLKGAAMGGIALTTASWETLFELRTAAASEAAEPLWPASSTRSKIVVVSDLHFGIDDRFAETVRNRELFVNFLQQLQQTEDVRELVIAGDFLDEWFLPLDYTPVHDFPAFYRAVARNNEAVMAALRAVMAAGIKLVYVIGNHDMTLTPGLLSTLLPGVVEIHDAKGLGRYITGDREEIVIEHCHRYDPYSAPDRVSNRTLSQSDETMYPPGYFYARMGTSWVVEGRPQIAKHYPSITKVPQASDTDQMGAYVYAKTLEKLFLRITEKSDFSDKVFHLDSCGLSGRYSLQDLYPVEQADGTISAPVLFRHFQRSWDERQEMNGLWTRIPFLEAGKSAGARQYYAVCAQSQYFSRQDANYEVVVFGHTHIPDYQQYDGKVYINSGTWVDHNSDYPAATRTFAVIETGDKDSSALYTYEAGGKLTDLTARIRNT